MMLLPTLVLLLSFEAVYSYNYLAHRSVRGSFSRLLSSFVSQRNSDDDKNFAEDTVGAPVGPLPTVSSKLNFMNTTIEPKYDLWIAGAGTLGTIAAKLWIEENPNDVVIAETKTTNRHEELLSLGVIPRLRENRNETVEARLARNVLICLPPSGAANYESELASVCVLWSGPMIGNLVFTSSTVVYGDQSNTVNEAFRLDSRSNRATNMINAEEAIGTREGSILRLAGLYNEMRGPHTYWLKAGEVSSNADGIVNMLHYEDAAAAAIAAIKCNERGKVYLVCDDLSLSRMEICEAALESGLFPGASIPKFQSLYGARGKICDSSVSRKLLNWTPKHKSFRSFMRKIGGLETSEDEEREREKESGKEEEKTSGLWLPGDDLGFESL